MERKYLWRHLQIYACNPPHGVNINITILLNFLWHAHQMVLFLLFHLHVFVGSISDIELTRESGFLTTLQDKPGISIMADRGFTIKDMLKDIGIELNIPPFMEGRSQLPAKEVQEGRRIASVCINAERAIGRMKNFAILQGTFPISMSRIINQVVCVCAFLTSFMPALVPPLESLKDEDVENYFQALSSDSEYDEISEDEEPED